MKKILAIILALLVICTMFTGCVNRAVGFGNMNYKLIHIDTYHYSGCLTVDRWYDGTTGIEVYTHEAGNIFVSEGMYILLDGTEDCPFCAGDEDG